jgi:hypothetical protein
MARLFANAPVDVAQKAVVHEKCTLACALFCERSTHARHASIEVVVVVVVVVVVAVVVGGGGGGGGGWWVVVVAVVLGSGGTHILVT